MATFKELFEKQAKQALDESVKYQFAKGKEEQARIKYEEKRTEAQQALGDVAKAYSEGKATFKAAASDGFGFTATFNQINNDIEGAFGSVEENFKKGADMVSSGMADVKGAFSSFSENFKKAKFNQLEKKTDPNRDGGVELEGVKKEFGRANDAIKELTGGIVDIGEYIEDAVNAVKAVGDLVMAPFKIANEAIKVTTKFFTGKEVDLGGQLNEWWSGTAQELDKDGNVIKQAQEGFSAKVQAAGSTLMAGASAFFASVMQFIKGGLRTIGGVFVTIGTALQGAAIAFIGGFTALMASIGGFISATLTFASGLASATIRFIASSVTFIGATLAYAAAALTTGIIKLVTVVPAFIVAAGTLIAGIMSAVGAFLVAAAPFIAIGLAIAIAVAALILGVMYLVKNFDEIKANIQEKVAAIKERISTIIQNIKDAFVNTFQMIFDAVREKILQMKTSIPFLSSDEDLKELEEIRARQEERKKKKEGKEEVTATPTGLEDKTDEQLENQQKFARKVIDDREAFIAEKEAKNDLGAEGNAARAEKIRSGKMDEFVYSQSRDIEGGKFDPSQTEGFSSDFLVGKDSEIMTEQMARMKAEAEASSTDLAPVDPNAPVSDITQARQAVDAERDAGGGGSATVNSVVQNNMSGTTNNNTYQQGRPTPRNEDPTGSRLSAVPA
tara:strand:- start:9080 stop:11095 length:2016 start_codon:yes stop_codon:yes gene_type:complete